MARTISEIQNEILDQVATRPEISGYLTSPSQAAIYRAFSYITAVGQWVNEKLFDAHKKEVSDIIAVQVPHKAKWYSMMAKKFQYGYDLVLDQDYYDNSALTEAQIEDAQIVKFAAILEVVPGLRVKVATIDAGDLAPLSAGQLAAFEEYMKRVKDAGVRLFVSSGDPDSLSLDLKIYYDPLVLDNSGARLDGTNDTPVPDAITDFLQNGVPFNGLFVLSEFIDALQAIEGVIIPELVSAMAKYGALPFQPIELEYNPDAGYLRINDPGDLTINYYPHDPI